MESKSFKWNTILLPTEFELIDAKMALDEIEDLSVITFIKS
jgi:hypothetical protein